MTKFETNSLKRRLFAVVPLLLTGASAYAGSVTFDFNSLGVTTSVNSGNTAAVNAANMAVVQTSIAAYMNTALTNAGCIGCSVTVSGAVVDKTYSGEGFAVGPNNGSGYKSLTLGNTDGANMPAAGGTPNMPSAPNTTFDSFLANTTDGSYQASQQITMKFSGFMINGSAGFDYEIFPDGSSNQPPDFIFEAGPNSNGVDPAVSSFGTGGTQLGVTPSVAGTTYTHSPNSGAGLETNAQLLGTWSGSLTNATELDFIDWPATIGMDNMTLSWNTPPPSVPEPVSIVLLGTVAAGLLLKKKLRKA